MSIKGFFKSKYKEFKHDRRYKRAALAQVRKGAKAEYWKARSKAERTEAAAMAQRDAKVKYNKPKKSFKTVLASMDKISTPSIPIYNSIPIHNRKRKEQSSKYDWGSFGG